MAQPVEDPVQKILNLFKDQHTVVLAGDAGVGKTWVARKFRDSATKDGSFYGSIWIVPAVYPGKKDFLDIIASQLSLSSSDEECDDDEDSEEVKNNEDKEPATLQQRIVDKLETMRTGKTKSQAPKTAKGAPGDAEERKSTEPEHEGVTAKSKYLLVVLDDITLAEERSIVPTLEKILHLNLLKMLITRKEPTNSKTGAADGGQKDIQVEPIRVEPLSLGDTLTLLKERVKREVYENEKFNDVAEKLLGLPAAIILIAEALNNISLQDGGRALEYAMEEAADLKGDDITGVLRFAYKMLPEGVTRDCYWLSRQLLFGGKTVHFSELITYWILEGCFDHHKCIEKAYEEGHHVLMDLKNRGMLKGHSNHVYLEKVMLKLRDERQDGFSGSAKLGMANILRDGLGRITLADGMIRTVCRDKGKNEISTLVIDGVRLCKEVSGEYFKSLKGLQVLVIFNPMFENLPPGLSDLKDLQVLVLRGCRHLKKVDEISQLTKLSVLEISGASSLDDIDKDFFKDMEKLQSVNLSGLNTASVPASLFDRGEVRHLILRECLSVTDLPSLKNMKKLEMVDMSGSVLFDRLQDGNINNLTALKTLNVSGTRVKNLPILGKLSSLERILVRNCPSLTMIRSLGGNLEVLDISGSTSIKDLNSAQLHTKHCLRVLDLSETGIASFPPNITNVSHLNLKGCFDLPKLPSTKAMDKLLSLDLSGAVKLDGLEDKSFEHLKFLRSLNISRTKIRQLPTLSSLVELRELMLKACTDLMELHGLASLEKLEVLDLSECSSLIISREESFNHISRLNKLNLSATKIEALPRDCFPSSLCQLILRDCEKLKQLPSLESLSKLEELDLCGAVSLAKFKAGFLNHMAKLKILNLSKTHPDELPSLSHLTNLRQLSLSGCPCVPSGLEALTELQLLDLSETKVQTLSLGNQTKLRKLLLSNCSNLQTLRDLGSLSHLEVLDLSGTGVTQHFPDEVNRLTHLHKLHLPNVKQIHFDWSKIKYLPADFKLDPCGEPRQVSNAEITALATTESQSPSILVRGTGFFQFLEENSWLWDKGFKRFHFSVWLPDEEGGDGIMKVPGDMSLFKYCNSRGKFPNSRDCSLLEIHGPIDFPGKLESALRRAQSISVIDNAKISSISDLGNQNVNSMVRCWFEGCVNLRSIFTRKEDGEIGKQLKSLYLCKLPSLESLCNKNLQSGIFSNLKNLHLDDCSMIVHIFSTSVLPVNLQTLKVRFCNKLETLFNDNGSTEHEIPQLRTLELFYLPALKKVGAATPALETLKARACEELHGSFTNLKTGEIEWCPNVVIEDASKVEP